MQVIRLPPGNMSQIIQIIQIIQIRNLSAVKDLDQEVGIGNTSYTYTENAVKQGHEDKMIDFLDGHEMASAILVGVPRI